MTSTIDRSARVADGDARAPTGPPPTGPSRRFRPDIEGLRAVAVLLVVLYHADLGPFGGGYVGVDVFFVISGFLITRQLVDGVGRRGIRALPTFYAHRIRRLLPAATLVAAVTVVAARWWAPILTVPAIAWDAVSTAVYALNERLAASGAQYLHAGDQPSPLQHYWSLAVEEQFYVVWPVLVAGLAAAGRRARRPVLAPVLVGLVAASLACSVLLTRSHPALAYFSLITRAWELGIGALLSLGVARLDRLSRRAAVALSGLAVAAVVGSAVAYGSGTAYPGVAALVPVLATAAVLAVGTSHPGIGVERLLARPVLQRLGRLSYSWYLWHWPLLVLAPHALGRPLPWAGRLVIVVVALGLAAATHALVEQPVRRAERRNAAWFRTGLGLSSAVAVVALLVGVSIPALVGAGEAVALPTFTAEDDGAVPQVLTDAIGAGLLLEAVPSNLEPSVRGAVADVPPSDGDGCHADFAVVDQGPCVYGDPAGTRTVVLFGDSHAQHWLPALLAAGAAAGWRIVSWTKSACPVADLTVSSPALRRRYFECDTWRDRTIERIAALHPDLVIAGQSDDVGVTLDDDVWATGTVRGLDRLGAAVGDAPVVLLQDTPSTRRDVPGCVASHLADVRPCIVPGGALYRTGTRHDAVATAVATAGYPSLEPLPWICAAAGCPPIIGNVLVYRDNSHFTATFSRLLAPALQPFLDAAAA